MLAFRGEISISPLSIANLFDIGKGSLVLNEINHDYRVGGSFPSPYSYMISLEFTYTTILGDTIYRITIKYYDLGVHTYQDTFSTKADFINGMIAIFGSTITCLCAVNPTGIDYITQTDDMIDYLRPSMSVNVSFAMLYEMYSPKNKLDKALTHVDSVYLNFNQPISIRNFTFNLKRDYKQPKFNYVYMGILERFYYVQSPQLMKNYMSMELVEDVLMTWKDVIKEQTAFVTRSQSHGNSDMIDDLVRFNINKKISYSTINLTVGNDFFNYDMFTMVTIDGTV